MLVEFMIGLVKKSIWIGLITQIIAFILIIPVGIFLPQILGGGNQLVLSLTEQDFSFQVLLVYFLIRFVWSMISYGSWPSRRYFPTNFGAWLLTLVP